MESFTKQLYKPLETIYSIQYHLPFKLLQRKFCFKKNDVSQWYKTLGVPNDSDQETVRVAYIELVKRYHPDSKSSEADVNKFQEIERAYRNLQNKFSSERYDKSHEGEYGLYYKENSEEKIEHTAPQHRQYLSYEGIGSGTPSQRQRQYTKYRAAKAMENVTEFRINKVQDDGNKALTLKESRKKAKDIKTRFGMDRLVEDLIQESMSKGEFDNLPGKGKPLKNLQKTHNPYVDFVTHKMNEVLIDNGFTPAWITLQKEITEHKQKIKDKLVASRAKLGPLPLSQEEQLFWEEIKIRLADDVKVLNSKIAAQGIGLGSPVQLGVCLFRAIQHTLPT
ncbi:dnaJ homolog subfamily C member 28 isoform X2 [Rhodnius prolixus]|uniref:dnaJ homolog subfamily C member 28 isoform X2 n=1 Tax=Rhodnius prolixus TaxID=13249 RepID=UPI003D189B0E